MSRSSHNTDGTLVGTVLSVADLLAEPRLARIYDYLSREGPTTVDELCGALSTSQTTAYADVDRLVEANGSSVTRWNNRRRSPRPSSS